MTRFPGANPFISGKLHNDEGAAVRSPTCKYSEIAQRVVSVDYVVLAIKGNSYPNIPC